MLKGSGTVGESEGGRGKFPVREVDDSGTTPETRTLIGERGRSNLRGRDETVRTVMCLYEVIKGISFCLEESVYGKSDTETSYPICLLTGGF